ncbi:MAG TPA: hypothetical protein VIJ18_05120 [Microbacteriaceae bacterium]
MENNATTATSTRAPASDPGVASAQADGYFREPSVVGDESVYRPHSALDSAWEDTLATASTQLLHEWIDGDSVTDQQPQPDDLA